jgi:hypothetical protein
MSRGAESWRRTSELCLLGVVVVVEGARKDEQLASPVVPVIEPLRCRAPLLCEEWQTNLGVELYSSRRKDGRCHTALAARPSLKLLCSARPSRGTDSGLVCRCVANCGVSGKSGSSGDGLGGSSSDHSESDAGNSFLLQLSAVAPVSHNILPRQPALADLLEEATSRDGRDGAAAEPPEMPTARLDGNRCKSIGSS